jgi:hypothetical protein
MTEVFICYGCLEQGREMRVALDIHLRCAVCGSDDVESLEYVEALARMEKKNNEAKQQQIN